MFVEHRSNQSSCESRQTDLAEASAMSAYDPKRTLPNSHQHLTRAESIVTNDQKWDVGADRPQNLGGIWDMSVKRIIIAAFITGAVSACGSTYTPSEVKLDARSAQEEVRTLLAGASYISWHGDYARVADVRFRSDGMGFLVEIDGSQTMQPCYYAGNEGLHVIYDALGGPYGFAARYGTYPLCPGNVGSAWFNSESEAKRLADAIFSLKNAPR